jgi:hypothetical protein
MADKTFPCPQCASTRIKTRWSFWWPNSDSGHWETVTPLKVAQFAVYVLLLAYGLFRFATLFAHFLSAPLILKVAMVLMALLVVPIMYYLGKSLFGEAPGAPRKYDFTCRDCGYAWSMRRADPKAELELLPPLVPPSRGNPDVESWKKKEEDAIENWNKKARR